MEPNDVVKPQSNPSPVEPNDDLHAEGIDVVGSPVSFDNEFSTGATDERVAEPLLASAQSKTTDPEPSPEPTPAATPVIPQAPQAMPLMAKQAFYSPTTHSTPVPKQPDKPRDDASIKPLRTFKSDAEEAVRYGGANKVTMAIAEQKKRENLSQSMPERTTNKSVGVFVAIAGVFVVILIGGGGWYYWTTLTGKPQTGVTQSAAKIATIIPYAKGAIALISQPGSPLTDIQVKLSKADAGLNNVFAVIPLLSATSTAQAPASMIFAGSHMPSRLARSLSGEYMFGVYVYDLESPFLILKNTFYQNAFSGMLEWEKDLKDDFSGFISQSYPMLKISDLDTANWTDSVVSNIDVRQIKDAAGKTVLAYAFADKDTIVLTTSESGLKYLLDKLLQVRTIQ